MAAVEVAAVMVVAVEVIVMVTALGDLTVRMADLITERIVLNTIVTGTAAEAVIVTQVVIDMLVREEVPHVMREALEIDQGHMIGPLVDLEVMMTVIEKRLLC